MGVDIREFFDLVGQGYVSFKGRFKTFTRPTNSFFTFSNSVVEIPLKDSSLSLFYINKDRVASSMATSAREETFADLNICLDGPSKFVRTNSKKHVKAPKMLSKRG